MTGRSTVTLTSAPAGRSLTRHAGTLALAALIVVGASLPLWTQNSPFLLMLAAQAVIAGILALSLDMLTGNTGLLSFGHAAWYGFGAYTAGLASRYTAELLLLLPFVIAVTSLVALATGAILVRQIGKSFAILTLALSQILQALVFVLSDITGGEDGLQGIPTATVLGLPLQRNDFWYWLLYGILVLVLLGALALRRAPLGRAWLAIRDNTERARFIGIRVNGVKLVAYTISAALAAVAGALLALFNGAASPDLLGWYKSGQVLMYVVLGGVGTIVGPILGATLFTFAEHFVSSLTDAWLIYFGGLFVLIVIVAPGGLFGVASGLLARLRRGAAASR